MPAKLIPFKTKVVKFVERFCYLVAILEDNSINCYLLYDSSVQNFDDIQRFRTIDNHELENVVSFTVGNI